MTSTVHTVQCREQKINRVVVFNDRAEVTRLVPLQLAVGTNEVLIKVCSSLLLRIYIPYTSFGPLLFNIVLTLTLVYKISEHKQYADGRFGTRRRQRRRGDSRSAVYSRACSKGGGGNHTSEQFSSNSVQLFDFYVIAFIVAISSKRTFAIMSASSYFQDFNRYF